MFPREHFSKAPSSLVSSRPREKATAVQVPPRNPTAAVAALCPPSAYADPLPGPLTGAI
jgi:hypothetical protein